MASATSATPISSRKASASILVVGWRRMKLLIGKAANIITAMAMTTAVTMIGRLSVMPTAVITESSENTRSMARNWTSAEAKDVARSEENTSELQSLMRISYAVVCLKKKHT